MRACTYVQTRLAYDTDQILDLYPQWNHQHWHVLEAFVHIRHVHVCWPNYLWGVQFLCGRVLDSRPRRRRHFVARQINPSLVRVQPRKTRPYITERLFMGRKESYQTKTKPIILVLCRYKARWLAMSVAVGGSGFILKALPHFLTQPYQWGQTDEGICRSNGNT